ncbi:MAG: hypothetical protein M3P08_17215 [Thermoproteota archaeon]|nr:hypothetical protein [Thermoproteota archaeon]
MLKHTLVLPIFLVLVTVSGVHAYAQVEVKQSVTTNDSGQNTSIKTETKAPANICLGMPSACDHINCLGLMDCSTASLYMKLLQGTLNVTQKPGALLIHHCNEKCHTYRPADNGTIQKVS